MNGCEHYKVGQFQCRKDSLVLLTHTCKYVSIFKEFTADYSNAKFEQCRVVLVWHFYDHKCRHGVMFMRHGATRKKTVSVIIISNYVLTECLVYRGFYFFLSHYIGNIDCKKGRDTASQHINICLYKYNKRLMSGCTCRLFIAKIHWPNLIAVFS